MRNVIDYLIDNLPVELHLYGYNFLGPGTRLNEKLDNNIRGINLLDEYCKEHDLVYQKTKNYKKRLDADYTLILKAKERFFSSSSSLWEKFAAFLVIIIMTAKTKLTGKHISFKNLIRKTAGCFKKCCKKSKKRGGSLNSFIGQTILAAKKLVKNRKSVKVPRILPVPKTGGVLPLVPIFAGLSALGTLAGGAAGVVKAINETRDAKKNLAEHNRHNKMMEAIAIRNGRGLYLKPYKTGLGIFLGKKR